MDFGSEDELQAFLADWLMSMGHTVYREVSCPDGRIDLLTQGFLIECKRYLTPECLDKAAGQLGRYRRHFPTQQMVIAGLTPRSNMQAAYTVAQGQIAAGIRVWFVDQMPELLTYYDELMAPPEADRMLYPAQRRLALLPWHGRSAIAAFGLVALVMVALVFLARSFRPSGLTTQDEREWAKLHDAIAVWDLDTAQGALSDLRYSSDPCVAAFATQLDQQLAEQGAEGFRQVNAMKRTLNTEQQCQFEITPYEFSP